MFQLEVPELMSQHSFDFRVRQPFQQGIEEDDSLVPAETREIGVSVR